MIPLLLGLPQAFGQRVIPYHTILQDTWFLLAKQSLDLHCSWEGKGENVINGKIKKIYFIFGWKFEKRKAGILWKEKIYVKC